MMIFEREIEGEREREREGIMTKVVLTMIVTTMFADCMFQVGTSSPIQAAPTLSVSRRGASATREMCRGQVGKRK